MARGRLSDISTVVVVVVFVVRQPRHKATRTKELRRCMIRAHDEENEDRRREGGIQRRPTFYEGAGGTAGKVYRVRRAEGRKEGRSYAATRQGKATRTGGGWELAFSV